MDEHEVELARHGGWNSVGHDLVNHCVDDILVQGARPLFFLDYIATAKLVPEIVAEIVCGMAEACKEVGYALLGASRPPRCRASTPKVRLILPGRSLEPCTVMRVTSHG